MKDYELSIPMTAERETTLSGIIRSIRDQLFNFIKKRVPNSADAEDILQDVLFKLIETEGPVEQVSGWLFKVARNKIIDTYRKQKLPLLEDLINPLPDGEDMSDFKDILFNDDGNPETLYLRNLFWEELQNALDELPAEQKDAFILHELEGVSFKDMEIVTGVNVPTLITRKRYAILHLRKRLLGFKEELLNN